MDNSRPITERKIRSFVLREGRMTEGQKDAWNRLWPLYGINIDNNILDYPALFSNHNPVVLEIGFGNGDSLVTTARNNPDINYIGIEVHRPGVGRLLSNIEKYELNNLKAIRHDAIEVLENNIPDHSLDGICLFFADPWPKKKHQKRRIVQDSFASHCHNKLKTGGYLHMATDWQHYAKHMLKVMEARKDYINTAGASCYAPRPDYRPLTKFEDRGKKLGHGVWDLIYLST